MLVPPLRSAKQGSRQVKGSVVPAYAIDKGPLLHRAEELTTPVSGEILKMRPRVATSRQYTCGCRDPQYN